MKRLFALLLTMGLVLCGCTAQAPSESSSPPEESISSPQEEMRPQPEEQVVIARPFEELGGEGMTIYQEHTIYLNPEADTFGMLALFTDAEQMEDGSFALDDRNDWMLLWQMEGKDYPLVERTALSQGGVDCRAWVDMDTGLLHLLVTVSQSAGLTLTEYVYDAQTDCFTGTPLIHAGNINLWV